MVARMPRRKARKWWAICCLTRNTLHDWRPDVYESMVSSLKGGPPVAYHKLQMMGSFAVTLEEWEAH